MKGFGPNKVIDLRKEIMLLFESIITVYLLEEDVSRDLIESHSWADNGIIETT